MTHNTPRVFARCLAIFAAFAMFALALVAPSNPVRAAVPQAAPVVSATLTVKAQAAAGRKIVKNAKRYKAFRWAKKQAGKPYVYGAQGPGSFDCSGLVMKAYKAAGISLPRTTGGMLGSSKLIRVSKAQVRWGDLAFFGRGHVELFGHWTNKARTKGVTFGAHRSGTRISYRSFNSAYYGPTAFYRIAGAN